MFVLLELLALSEVISFDVAPLLPGATFQIKERLRFGSVHLNALRPIRVFFFSRPTPGDTFPTLDFLLFGHWCSRGQFVVDSVQIKRPYFYLSALENCTAERFGTFQTKEIFIYIQVFFFFFFFTLCLFQPTARLNSGRSCLGLRTVPGPETMVRPLPVDCVSGWIFQSGSQGLGST